VIDTIDTWLLFEPERHPVFVVPARALPPLAETEAEADERDGHWVALAGQPDRRVRLWPAAPSDLPMLAELAAVPLDIADEWWEEDVPLSFRPRDPYRRVDVLASSRHVAVRVDGVAVAATDRPCLLLETGMPPIWYIPLTAVKAEVLRPSERRSRCQYKGEASYWDVVTERGTHEALVWGYSHAIRDAATLAGHVAFTPWDPAVTTTVNGVVAQVDLPRPWWSNPSSHLPATAR
jgi:uncharacterized protein (DUF427 family)